MGFKGRCLCGSTTYESSAEPVAFMLCHCRDCQYVSGGEPAAVVVVPKDAFKLIKGSIRGFSVKGDSGNLVERQFCTICGTPMFSVLHGMPHLFAIKAGTMDDPSRLKPTAFIWTKSAQPWAHLDKSAASFERQPQ